MGLIGTERRGGQRSLPYHSVTSEYIELYKDTLFFPWRTRPHALHMPCVSPPFSSSAKNTAHSGTKLNRTIRLLIALPPLRLLRPPLLFCRKKGPLNEEHPQLILQHAGSCIFKCKMPSCNRAVGYKYEPTFTPRVTSI